MLRSILAASSGATHSEDAVERRRPRLPYRWLPAGLRRGKPEARGTASKDACATGALDRLPRPAILRRPMKLDAWQADRAQIENDMLDPKLQVRPDTVFEIGATSIAGAPAISVYQAAQFFGTRVFRLIHPVPKAH